MEQTQGTIVTLLDEDGNEVQFDLLMSFDYEGKRYIALLPTDGQAGVEEDAVVLLETLHENGSEIYKPIENPILLDEVFEEFQDLFDEEISRNDGEE